MFEYFKIDKSLSIPAYQQIYKQIKEQIENGNLHTGDEIPSEKEMIENFEVSQKEKAPRVKKSSLENKENHPRINQTPKKEMEQEQDGDERE